MIPSSGESCDNKNNGGRKSEGGGGGRMRQSWTPSLGSVGLRQCTHHANAVIRKQKKNMLMKQLVF